MSLQTSFGGWLRSAGCLRYFLSPGIKRKNAPVSRIDSPLLPQSLFVHLPPRRLTQKIKVIGDEVDLELFLPDLPSARLGWIMAARCWRWVWWQRRWQMGPSPADSRQVSDTLATIAWPKTANFNRQLRRRGSWRGRRRRRRRWRRTDRIQASQHSDRQEQHTLTLIPITAESDQDFPHRTWKPLPLFWTALKAATASDTVDFDINIIPMKFQASIAEVGQYQCDSHWITCELEEETEEKEEKNFIDPTVQKFP